MVACSAVLHWLAGRRLEGLWIMPDEAIYAQRALGFWHHGSLPLLRGQGAGYSVLYPILVAYPLSLVEHGSWELLKIVQALAVSLAALPVYVYGRRLMPRGYALLAAALTVCSPLLLYSGLVMTEVLFYPLAALALLAVAKAVGSARVVDQVLALVLVGVAVLTRVQAIVFVAVFALAVVVDAMLRRDSRRLRSFWPVWAVVAGAAVAALAAPGLFGAYAGTLSGSYPVGIALGLTFDHISWVVLSTGLFPAFALVLLGVDAVRGRERDPYARSLVVVTLCAVLLVAVQVGFFAARYSPHLLGRDLASLPPLLFLVLALWASRGAPRPRIAAVLAAFALYAVIALAPWNHLVSANALPDTFDLDVLFRLHSTTPANVVAIVSLLALVLALLVPRRLVLVLPVIVAAALVVNSVLASNDIVRLVEKSQAQLVGSPSDWIQQAATSSVAYVYDGETYWNSVWEQRFWNPRIDRVYTVEPSTVPGPIPQRSIRIAADGRLPFDERFVAAPDTHQFVGDPIAHVALADSDIAGLTLWRLESPPRLSLVERGFKPNGDMLSSAQVVVYDCAGGTLQLTLLPKDTSRLTVLLDRRPVVDADVAGQPVWRGSIPVPATHTAGPCVFTIHGQTLLGSTQVLFER